MKIKIIKLFGMPILILFLLLKTVQAEDKRYHDKNNKNTVLIFVSFSMPKQSLISILHDAQKIQAPVLLQGLVDHGFKTTFLGIHSLIKQAGGGGMFIDPTAFDRYRITQVPTIVVLSNADSCMDKISGDIPLFAAFQHLQHHGDCSSSEMPLLLQRLEKGNAHA